MAKMLDVEISPLPIERLANLLQPDRAASLLETAERGRTVLADRTVWNINSTAAGGGVAEMLATLLAYGRGVGVDTRWSVVHGESDFFGLTKRIHNALHGSAGDGSPLGEAQHGTYQRIQALNLAELAPRVREGDIVLLHDPQTAGMAEGLRERGARVMWRCHVGADDSNEQTDAAWAFLRPYVEGAEGFIFTREQYAPAWIPRDRLVVIPPSIDPYAVKNRELTDAQVQQILRLVGITDGGPAPEPVTFHGRDGSVRHVRSHPSLLGDAPPLEPDAQVVVQVSRWDNLKDMAGVMTAFVEQVAGAHPRAHLLLVGPSFAEVSDDPEGAQVYAECRAKWADLPATVRGRVHLLLVPMDDLDENALIVNAIQRYADVVVQKSLAEGFGLTVTEAMWKARPVVASAVGGIPDQIVDGKHGVLVTSTDLPAAGQAIAELLASPERSRELGEGARERVREEFLGDRHLRQYVELFGHLLRG
jgi:trehalose synthase